jgi:hypothetical protein
VTNVSRKQFSQSPPNGEDDSANDDSVEIFTLCSHLAVEETLLEPLNTALWLMETSFPSISSDEVDKIAIDYIEVLVLRYKLMGQVSSTNVIWCGFSC